MALLLAMPLLANAEPQRMLAGTVVDFHGKYGLVVRDPRGVLKDVVLHPGTIIKPEGLRLERGMKVIVIGQAADQTFAAGEIDAPLEQWPTARAAAFARVQRDAQRVDTTSINRNSDPGNARWSQVPDQYSLPYTKEPPR
jgi:hypothetical protein